MPATGSPAIVPADVVKDYLFVLKNASETHVKVTTILADFRGDPLADAELERLCKVFTDELGVGIAVALQAPAQGMPDHVHRAGPDRDG